VNRPIRKITGVALVAVAAAALATPASASIGGNLARGAGGAVFVQTAGVGGNQVVAYDRSLDGSLTQAGTYATGGLGGALTGAVVDHTASQSALAYDARHRVLYAINAGSDTVSVFAVRGDRLRLREILPSGGTFPVSVAVRGGLVYVLNARGGGSVQGYRSLFGVLLPLRGSKRTLGLDPSLTPEFVNTPGQVAFSPDGQQLLVTTKANGSSIDVFRVRWDGRLSAAPVVNSEPGTVPFGVAFDRAGRLLVVEAGTNALAAYSLGADGVLTLAGRQPTGQKATCWVVGAGGFFYASNAGSGTISGFADAPGGALTLLATTPTDAGTVDAAGSPDGRYLYVQTGLTGGVDAFRVAGDGSLSAIGSVVVPGAIGGEGIVAT
jgi:DNA-binding beta-propeller fold protein YncE